MAVITGAQLGKGFKIGQRVFQEIALLKRAFESRQEIRLALMFEFDLKVLASFLNPGETWRELVNELHAFVSTFGLDSAALTHQPSNGNFQHCLTPTQWSHTIRVSFIQYIRLSKHN